MKHIFKYLNLDYRVKAGALQFTMFIGVVIALLLAAFIILIHTYKTFKVQTDFLKESIENSDKGINYALQNKLQLNDTTLINLQDEDFKTLKVHRNFWGVFEKVIAVSNIKNKTFKKIALVGASQPDANRTALYLEEQNRPLVVVGNTKIQGDVYLPKQGVRTGNISGHSYYGNQLIYGNAKTSQSLPKLQNEILNQIATINKVYRNIDENQFLDLSIKRTYLNSFYKPLQVIYSRETIVLSEVLLTGHILVQSETKIIVDGASKLKDVVLVAPIIQIKNNVEGAFQAFATKEIRVGSRCKLNYPTALILNEEKIVTNSNTSNNLENIPFIKINKDSKIKGIVAYLGGIKNYKTQILIDEKATIIGEVYCNRNLELLGNVYGSVFTSGFVANQSGSVYQNHIYNGTIIVNNLSEEYVGLPFKNSKKDVAKWLY
ncbi:hypothetical protein [Wocania ichthyoenteri]|uniref:hypothetical protein n=1 Tax=Wocania ichthyoenteri TaxID=1230531 RepID=UPI001FCE0023|nr:hypothetical protein [Wocania ichthyoenteri]